MDSLGTCLIAAIIMSETPKDHGKTKQSICNEETEAIVKSKLNSNDRGEREKTTVLYEGICYKCEFNCAYCWWLKKKQLCPRQVWGKLAMNPSVIISSISFFLQKIPMVVNLELNDVSCSSCLLYLVNKTSHQSIL